MKSDHLNSSGILAKISNTKSTGNYFNMQKKVKSKERMNFYVSNASKRNGVKNIKFYATDTKNYDDEIFKAYKHEFIPEINCLTEYKHYQLDETDDTCIKDTKYSVFNE